MRNSELFEARTEDIPEIHLFGACTAGSIHAIKRLRLHDFLFLHALAHFASKF